MTDYNDVRKGIKHAQMDEKVYHFKVFLCVLFGIFVGIASQNIYIGIIATMIPAVKCWRTYMQIDEK